MSALFGRVQYAVVIGMLLCAGVASAQSIDNALREYRLGNYEKSALVFYSIFVNDANPDNRDQAEIYLADSLFKLEMYMPALYYYSDLFKAGPQNRYYLNAIQGLLSVRSKLHDHFIVPALINAYYNPEGYGQLDAKYINEVNYLIGSMSYRQGKYQDAQSFLEFVPPEAGERYFQARYLLAMVALRRGDSEGAINYMRGIIDGLEGKTKTAEQHRVWQLATLGLARAQYGIGNYKQAVEYYKQIPRFDGMWFEALYEMAWAYFQIEDHGHTLGSIQSVMSPYFAKRHIPEAYLIMATTYYVNCQWDRTRRTLETFISKYDPMVKQLSSYLKQSQQPIMYYNDVVAGGNGKFDEAIARQVRRSQRFLDFHHLLTHLDWELGQLKQRSSWEKKQLFYDIEAIIKQQQSELSQGIGSWTRQQLVYQREVLQGFMNQSSIIEFEVADSEKRWLEAGKNIIKGRRARLPRPEIPSDQWQHWNFGGEFWIDELGFYVHSVKSECIEGM